MKKNNLFFERGQMGGERKTGTGKTGQTSLKTAIRR